MRWVNFLHFYQPATQQKDILEGIVNQCYRPLFSGLLNNSRARLTVNVSGGLLEVLDKYGFNDVILDLKKLYETGRVEFTSTSCYHAFLPLISESEVRRQISLNNDTLKKYLGSDFSPKGFFPPEMGYTSNLSSVLQSLNYKYILLDEIAYAAGEKSPRHNVLYKSSGTDMNVFFRQRGPSNLVMSGIERDSSHLHEVLEKYSDSGLVITAMDGETFGHHRPGLENSFLEVFNNPDIEFIKFSDLLDQDIPVEQVNLLDSTWASSKEDINQGIQFISWKDPDNIIHAWQWELVNLMLSLVTGLKEGSKENTEIRRDADRGLASDQLFWACAKPWWSVEMIESGAHLILKVIESVPNVSEQDKSRAQLLYRQIISTAFEWQRTGKIREMNIQRNITQRIPFKERTFEAGGNEPAIYQAFLDMMRLQEKEAASKGEYEKAIMWRDSVYKIETKNDIYDAINAIDLLRMEVSNEKIEKILDEYTEAYKKIRGGQPEQRSN